VEQKTCDKRKEVEVNGNKKVGSKDASIVEQDNAERHSCTKLSERLHVNGLSSWWWKTAKQTSFNFYCTKSGLQKKC